MLSKWTLEHLKKAEEAVNSAKIAAVCDLLVFGFGVVVVVVRHCVVVAVRSSSS